jgi:hypothetical protein
MIGGMLVTLAIVAVQTPFSVVSLTPGLACLLQQPFVRLGTGADLAAANGRTVALRITARDGGKGEGCYWDVVRQSDAPIHRRPHNLATRPSAVKGSQVQILSARPIKPPLTCGNADQGRCPI